MNDAISLSNQFTLFSGEYDWVLKLIITLSFGLLITAIELILYKIYLPRARRKKRHWREALIIALHRPLLYYVWLLVVSILLQVLILHFRFGIAFLDEINTIRRIVTLLFLFWFIMRFLRDWEKKSLEILNNSDSGSKNRRAFKDSTSINALAQVFRLLLIITVFLTLLSSMGISISTLLAFGGIGGLAISFAARDTLANLIGGLMIYWDRPFSVGDWVRSPDRNIEGTVSHIGWRLTCIRTFDKRPIYVPNGVFSNVVLENPSRMSNRRIQTLIGIRYDDAAKVKAITADIEEMVRNHPDLDTSQAWFVSLVEFGASSLNIKIYTFTKTTNWIRFQAIQQDIFMKVIDIVEKHDAEFAFPTQTLHVPNVLKIDSSEEHQEGSHETTSVS